MRGKARRSFDAAVRRLASEGCKAGDYRLTGEGVDRICAVHLYGRHRLLVCFPDDRQVVVLLVGEHTSDDPEVESIGASTGCSICPSRPPNGRNRLVAKRPNSRPSTPGFSIAFRWGPRPWFAPVVGRDDLARRWRDWCTDWCTAAENGLNKPKIAPNDRPAKPFTPVRFRWAPFALQGRRRVAQLGADRAGRRHSSVVQVDPDIHCLYSGPRGNPEDPEAQSADPRGGRGSLQTSREGPARVPDAVSRRGWS